MCCKNNRLGHFCRHLVAAKNIDAAQDPLAARAELALGRKRPVGQGTIAALRIRQSGRMPLKHGLAALDCRAPVLQEHLAARPLEIAALQFGLARPGILERDINRQGKGREIRPVDRRIRNSEGKGGEEINHAERHEPCRPGRSRANGVRQGARFARTGEAAQKSRMSPALPLALVLALLTPPQWRVIDGDTIELEGERIRLAGIDTPEIFSPECDAERMLGARAAAALAALLQTSGIEIRRHGEDRYGRTIADVLVNGRDAGEILVAEGYAVTWEGRRHDWCGTS